MFGFGKTLRAGGAGLRVEHNFEARARARGALAPAERVATTTRTNKHTQTQDDSVV